jgi:hypothetical protein
MAEIHHLIRHQGIEEARRQAVSKHERMVVEAAYQVLSDDAERMGFTYSGFALTSLPHKPQECKIAPKFDPTETESISLSFLGNFP